MFSEICAYLRNWFDRKSDHTYIANLNGRFTISNGVIYDANGTAVTFQDGQYFRIIDSLFNDGVWKYGTDMGLKNEDFEGTIRGMAVPSDLETLVEEIEAWQEEYGKVGSAAMSPFNSESFGGYSYSKSGDSSGDGSGSASTWQGAFASRLARYRKI